jgi:hypothetical protein
MRDEPVRTLQGEDSTGGQGADAIDRSPDKTENLGKMMVHDRCAEAFFGTSPHVQ